MKTQSRSKPWRRNAYTACVVLFMSAMCSALPVRAAEVPSNPQATSLQNEHETPFQRLTADEIDWDNRIGGFGIDVVISGENAKAILNKGVDQSAELIKLLDKPDRFVVAHVLLTELWRVHRLDKEIFAKSIYRGYFISHNRLNLRVTWEDDMGKERKVVMIPDLDCQRKRLSEFWQKRYREFPSEFSSKTKVE